MFYYTLMANYTVTFHGIFWHSILRLFYDSLTFLWHIILSIFWLTIMTFFLWQTIVWIFYDLLCHDIFCDTLYQDFYLNATLWLFCDIIYNDFFFMTYHIMTFFVTHYPKTFIWILYYFLYWLFFKCYIKTFLRHTTLLGFTKNFNGKLQYWHFFKFHTVV